MTAPRTRWPRLVLLTTLAAAACGGGARPAAEAPAPGRPDRDLAALEALYRARVDENRSRFTEADVQFMIGMIAHHAQALIMSGLAPENGASPAVQTLAARIINAQKDEIAAMQKWLRDRGQPVPEIRIDGTNLVIHIADAHDGHDASDAYDAHDHHDMPGMLTQEELEELGRARGGEFDRLFLTYMIRHHEGAVLMVRDLFNTDGAGMDEEAFRLASDIQVDQTTEIARMEKMLSSLTARSDTR